MNDRCTLKEQRCLPCEGGVAPLNESDVRQGLAALEGWTLAGQVLEKTYAFANHYEAMAFVNALAWISHRQDHHPEVILGYKDCRVRYWTHAIGGLSQNDFICAAKVDALLAL